MAWVWDEIQAGGQMYGPLRRQKWVEGAFLHASWGNDLETFCGSDLRKFDGDKCQWRRADAEELARLPRCKTCLQVYRPWKQIEVFAKAHIYEVEAGPSAKVRSSFPRSR